jgi:hypothetical protein
MVDTNLYNTFFSNVQTGGNKAKDLAALLYEKRDLLTKTFANLIVQLGITYYAMERYSREKEKDKKNKNVTILVIIYLFAFIIVLGFIPMPTWLKLILFCGFSYGAGYLLSNLKVVAGEEVINTALLGTMSIFGIMFSLGLFMLLSGIKLGFRTGLILFYSLLFLILARIVNYFTAQSSTFAKGLTIFGILLFSVYIIYDTNTILQKNYNGDFIIASIDYYLDIINIFVKLVSLNKDQ